MKEQATERAEVMEASETYFRLQIRSPSRLHFGLMELCTEAPNCYAGMGVMLEEPSMQIELQFTDVKGGIADSATDVELEVPSVFQERAATILQNRSAFSPSIGNLALGKISMQQAVPLHCGLGTGTQFACLLAAAMELAAIATAARGTFAADWQRVARRLDESRGVQWLTSASGRGLRSAIGLTGFLHGGLVLDHGYSPTQRPPRRIQTDVIRTNSDWRVVLLRPRDSAHASQPTPVHGAAEADAIRRLAQSANPHREQMARLAHRATEHAQATSADAFRQFTSTLDDYMHLAGGLFAETQGGLYNGPTVERAVSIAKEAGLHAVGQSSWGPAVFGFAANQDSAEASVKSILAQQGGVEPLISSINCNGASFRLGRHARQSR